MRALRFLLPFAVALGLSGPASAQWWGGGGGGGSSVTSANPSAKVGPTAVNGSAATFTTSDSAPAIDLTAAYNWTGAHNFAAQTTYKLGTCSSVSINGQGAGSNDGFYWPTTQDLGWCVSGTERIRLGSGGAVSATGGLMLGPSIAVPDIGISRVTTNLAGVGTTPGGTTGGSLRASHLQAGDASTLTLAAGEMGFLKITASGSAPGAAGGKMELVCGTNAGSAKLIAYAGTSTTPVTILDNIGSGVTGC